MPIYHFIVTDGSKIVDISNESRENYLDKIIFEVFAEKPLLELTGNELLIGGISPSFTTFISKISNNPNYSIENKNTAFLSTKLSSYT